MVTCDNVWYLAHLDECEVADDVQEAGRQHAATHAVHRRHHTHGCWHTQTHTVRQQLNPYKLKFKTTIEHTLKSFFFV